MSAFSDPQAVARYAENPPRMVPGFTDMQRMAMLLLAERAPSDAEMPVLGAGGGLELRVFAEGQPGWSFVGVDPAGSAAFSITSGIDPARANAARAGIAERLPILSPEDDEQLLREAGFGRVSLFYAGFAFRGWVAYA